MIYLQLFWEFFKTGLFAVGGGLATLPFLYDIAARYPWYDNAMLADMIAISESTPGPIGVNMATYAGFTTAGILGALVATFALVLPSVVIIVLIAKFLAKFNDNPLVKRAFYALRPVVAGLIAAAGWSVITITVLRLPAASFLGAFNLPALVLFAAMTAGAFLFSKVHPTVFIGLSAVAGIILKL